MSLLVLSEKAIRQLRAENVEVEPGTFLVRSKINQLIGYGPNPVPRMVEGLHHLSILKNRPYLVHEIRFLLFFSGWIEHHVTPENWPPFVSF